MKNDYDIRRLFETLSPDSREIDRIERAVLKREKPHTVRRLRPVPVAALLIMLLIVTAAAASAPSVIRYFFPGVGIVEVPEGEDTPPLYMILDSEADTGLFDLLYGYWYGDTVEVYFRSPVRYEERETAGELLQIGVKVTPEGYIQTYRLTFSDVTHEEAAAGIDFDGKLLRFNRMPAEYCPYIVEDTGLRLTMIPLTEDLTVFAMAVEYLDGRGGLELLASRPFSNLAADPTMYLIDEKGTAYPMIRYYNSQIFTVQEIPSAPVAGFRSDMLAFRRDFGTDTPGTSVIIPLPGEGDAANVNIPFTFPDGVTMGKITAVGCNNGIEYEENSRNFPMGSLTVVTEAAEQNGIRYWYHLHYGESYHKFLEQYLVYESRSSYDMSPLDSMAPRILLGRTVAGNGMIKTEHYVPDGKKTVELIADSYAAEAPGSWNIEFVSSGILQK